jgi:HD-like signal output (HDOD) protein
MEIRQIIDNVSQLVSLPAACIRLNEMVEDPSCSAEEIGRVINQDVALTARILRLANSPLYGLVSQVDTVSRAVTILGTRQVRDLALATAAVTSFQGIPNSLVSMQSFWEHSIYCALCARTLAMECLKRQREAVFVAGLLHDIGKLVLFNQLPDLSRRVLEMGELARRWSLPTNLQECIAFHHDPGKAEQSQVEVAIVHIANSAAILAERDIDNPGVAPEINPIAWKLTGLDEEIIPITVASAQAQISSTRALLAVE